MQMFDSMSPVEIKISLGMLQHEEVRTALGALLSAMGKAQESINAQLEQEMRAATGAPNGLLPVFPRKQ